MVSSIKNAEKELIDLVKKIQTKYVKLSTGTYDYNSFTDIDLDNFHKRDVPAEIEKNLLTDTKFLSLVITIKRLQPEQWGSIKSQALKTYRPSFAEVGGVKSDGSAQTVAGQIAEKEIVEKIIEVMSAIKSKDEKEIFKMID